MYSKTETMLKVLKIARAIITSIWGIAFFVSAVSLMVVTIEYNRLQVDKLNATMIILTAAVVCSLVAMMLPVVLHLYFPNVMMNQAELLEKKAYYDKVTDAFIKAKRKFTNLVVDNIIAPQLPHITVKREFYNIDKNTHTLRIYDENGANITCSGPDEPTWDITFKYKDYTLFSPGQVPVADPSEYKVYIELPKQPKNEIF